MNSRFKTPLLFGLIGSSITFICALIGVIYLSNYTNYFEFCEAFMAQVLSNGMTVEDVIKEMAPVITESMVRVAMYYYFLISGMLSMLLCIPCIVLSILSFRSSTLSAEDFQKRNKLHVFLLISFGLSYLANSYEMGSTALSAISIFAIIALVLVIIGFFKALSVVRFNKYLLKVQTTRKAYEEKLRQEQEMKAAEEAKFANAEANQIGEENLEKPETHEETATQVDQVKLDELYSLLSKLEKSYKNGEVTQEDYERMKKTILENYMK